MCLCVCGVREGKCYLWEAVCREEVVVYGEKGMSK